MSDPDTRYTVVTHPGADDDLNRIVTFIAQDRQRPTDAREFALAFNAFAAKLHTFPAGYTRVSEGPPRPAHKRTFKTSYLIFHEVFEAEKIVRVLYVWDGRREDRPDLGRQDDPLKR